MSIMHERCFMSLPFINNRIPSVFAHGVFEVLRLGLLFSGVRVDIRTRLESVWLERGYAHSARTKGTAGITTT